MSKFYPHAGVFQDEQRHTCIRLMTEEDMVIFIPMSTPELKVERLPNLEFDRAFCMQLEDYPVKQAAASYLGATWLGVTPEARTHLEKLSEASLSTNHTESKMTATATEGKKSKKVAAPAAKPEAASKAKATKKVAAPAAAAKAEKAAAGPDKRKITLLVKDNPKREGSASYDRYELYRSCKTVQAFLEAGGKAADIAWDAGHEYISVSE